MNRNLRRAQLSKKLRALLVTIAMVFGLGVTGAVMATPASADDAAKIDTAVNWAVARNGQHVYDGLCLSFVYDAYADAGVNIGSGYGNAIGYWNAHSGHQSGENPPKGALVFWDVNQYNSDGHVALSLGNGMVISTYERSNHNVHTFAISDRNNAGYRSTYLGWMMPPGITAGSTDARPTASGNVPWSFTVLEGDSGAQSGQSGDIGKGAAVTTYNGSQQAFYYDATGGNLRHAWRGSGGSWSFETLDGAGGSSGRMDGNVGLNPTVAVYGDSIQVFYYDAGNGNLRHAFASSTSGWQFETLDGDSGAVSHQNGNVGASSKAVSYASNGNLYVFYPNTDTGNLRMAVADATGWHFVNVDGDAGSLAGQAGNYGQAVGASLTATVVGSEMQLFYYEANGDNLRHAWYNTTSGWHFERLDGDSGSISGYDGSVGQNPSVAVMGSSIQLFYYDAGTGSLRHAWSGSSGWQFENLDGGGSSIGPNRFPVGLYSSAVSLDGSSVQVVYFDNRWSSLRHAWSDSSGWHFENLDGLGGGPAGRVNANVGSFPALISFGGTLNAFYYDITSDNLRMATAQ